LFLFYNKNEIGGRKTILYASVKGGKKVFLCWLNLRWRRKKRKKNFKYDQWNATRKRI